MTNSHHWQIGDTVTERYLGRGVVTQNTPQITIKVFRGVGGDIEVRGSQSTLLWLGWQREGGAAAPQFSH